MRELFSTVVYEFKMMHYHIRLYDEVNGDDDDDDDGRVADDGDKNDVVDGICDVICNLSFDVVVVVCTRSHNAYE